jgi:hypothetical protein
LLKIFMFRRKRLTRSQLTALGRRINFAKSVLYMASALQDGPMAGKVSFPTFRFSWVFSSGFKSDPQNCDKKTPCCWHPCSCSLLVLSTLLFLASPLVLNLASLLLLAFLLLMVPKLFAGIPSIAGVPAIDASLFLF